MKILTKKIVHFPSRHKVFTLTPKREQGFVTVTVCARSVPARYRSAAQGDWARVAVGEAGFPSDAIFHYHAAGQ